MNADNVKFEELYLKFLVTKKRTLQAELNEIERQIATLSKPTEIQKNDSTIDSLELKQVKPQA